MEPNKNILDEKQTVFSHLEEKEIDLNDEGDEPKAEKSDFINELKTKIKNLEANFKFLKISIEKKNAELNSLRKLNNNYLEEIKELKRKLEEQNKKYEDLVRKFDCYLKISKQKQFKNITAKSK